ncbi:hypothetical protein PA17_01691 [Pseudomonas aeruginosa]|uniref:hypothetical protein n=1 Tax=Pseudomonas aeruginosa TaxID=287 RepID=UPI000DEF4686|nr:hypothetical protein [Pseudomonas aeruginosa]RCM97829.1 hypothetical protein PA17_01691 [Pseudomonas aeruginosa]
MSAAQDFNRLYTDVAENISRALSDIAELKVENKDGQQQLSEMMQRLRVMQERFNTELDFLENHAEWDRFTMAFFGETNAGKSTIIESLRILFKEESRQQLLQKNQSDLEQFERALIELVEQLRSDLGRVYAAYAGEVATISQCTDRLTKTVDAESRARLQVAQDESSARVTRKLIAVTVAGIAVGAGAMALALQLAGS